MLTGPIEVTVGKAMLEFWGMYKHKEDISMSQDDYKRGVEDGTKTLFVETGSVFYRPSEINAALENRRKSLLTKKVTRWVNVYSDNGHINTAPWTFDSKEESINAAGPHILATVSFEVEVPL